MASWAACCAVTGDETGRLYGVARAGSAQLICVADVGPGSLNPPDAQDACVSLSDVSSSQIIATSPPISFDVAGAAASADGHQLLLWGSTREDLSLPVLALVDLYGSQPLHSHSSPAAAAAAAAAAATAGQHPPPKQRLAPLHFVHRELHRERPGMRILQVAWHPSSSSHFGVLSSDNRWRLYHCSHLAEPEQTFWLRPPGSHQGGGATLGLRRGGGAGGIPPRFTSFAFGPPGTGGWASLAVMFLASDGGLFLLCPVAPFGLRLLPRGLQQLLDASDGTAHAWLLAAFLSLLAHESATVAARPHMLETSAPALQGPLNAGAESLRLKLSRSVACTLAVTSSVTNVTSNVTNKSDGSFSGLSLGGGGEGADMAPGFSVVASGFSNGVVYAHALEVGQVVPVWLDSAPQCVFDSRGEVAAVRYEAEPVAVAPAAAGLSSVPEDEQQQQSAAAAAAVGVVSPLLLLDVLRINLHLPPGSRAAAADSADWEDHWEQQEDERAAAGSVTDSEEESDAGYDPSASRQPGGTAAAARAAAAGSSRGGGFGVGDADDDDDEDDLEDQQMLQLRKVTLHAAPELPGRFWAAHDQGCWGINVRWLQQLSGRLEQQPSSSSAGFGSSSHGPELLAPSLQELLVADASPAAGSSSSGSDRSAVVSSCVVGSALLGSGCVLLQGSGQLWFLRPRPAGVLGDGLVGADPAAAAGSSGGGGSSQGLAGAGGGQGLAEVVLTPEEQDVAGRMEDFYADICRGPRRLPPPARPADLARLTVSDPAGLAYVNDVTRWLVATHVQFATGAHADLVERVKQLHGEVAEQQSAAAVLQRLAAKAAARQGQLAARLARLQEVAGNLAERGSLLAGLHWSLPRPASAAEQQLDKQLEVWEQQASQLKVSWRALRNRIDATTQQSAAAAAGGSGTTPGSASRGFIGVPALAAAGSRASRARQAVTAAGPGPVAVQQLERLKAALAAQNDVITAARARLAVLCDEVEGFRLEHPEVELPGKLRSQLVV